MLELFYKYVAKELIYDYLEKNPPIAGDKYHIIIENEPFRLGLYNALCCLGKPITINNIFKNDVGNTAEESYNTFVIKTSDDNVGIILGIDNKSMSVSMHSSYEDYLDTLRNAVGVNDSNYKNYCVLFFLSPNPLSSLVDAGFDLQGEKGPLNPNIIIKSIIEKANDKLTKQYERMYLEKYLHSVAENILTGSCTLLDFQYAFSILEKGSLKDDFKNIDFFKDESIYDPDFSLTNANMKKRIEDNHDSFVKIQEIMALDDIEEIEKLLLKLLDDRLVNEILRANDWKTDVSFQEIIESKEKRLSESNFLFEGIVTDNDYLINTKVKGKNTTNSILLFDKISDELPIDIVFNKRIKLEKVPENLKFIGKKIKAKINNEFFNHKFGNANNTHTFLIHLLPISKDLFNNYKDNFSITSKGEIVFDTLPEQNIFEFGLGNDIVDVAANSVTEWKDNYKLHIDLSDYADFNKISFTLLFHNKEVKFNLRLFGAKPQLPVGPEDIFPIIWDKQSVFHGIPQGYSNFAKIEDGNIERATDTFWRKYLDFEKQFIDNSAIYLISLNDDENEVICNSTSPLDKEIIEALNNLYAYYRRHNTVPSLCYINDELEILLKNYYNSILNVINSINQETSLTEKELTLAKLGTVQLKNKVCLSPFSPIIVAYNLDFKRHYDSKNKQKGVLKIVSPFYLIPFISFENRYMKEYLDSKVENIHTWLLYEDVNTNSSEKTNNLTRRTVASRIQQFISHFAYLFKDKETPLIISSIGLKKDDNLLIGIIDYLIKNYQKGPQSIILHEYVDNLLEETFFEKLNRINLPELIIDELNKYEVKTNINEDTSYQEILHLLFNKITFYKHSLNEINNNNYSHIAFYQMDTGIDFITPNTNDLRLEMSMGGLISIPSTNFIRDSYYIGFGTKGLKINDNDYIYPMAEAINTIYANSIKDGRNKFQKNVGIVKNFKFNKSDLLDKIYNNSNWVTFLNPEVDLDFFYGQNVYIVHYTDQNTINAKYDTFTVTKHIELYENMLHKSYQYYGLNKEKSKYFNNLMMKYFNCLNGSWLLSIVNKQEYQIREKMSLVAACIALVKFIGRNKNVIWLPVSLDEIVRVSGSIGLPQEHIFTKKNLNVEGEMSDDLLMIGLDYSCSENLKLYFYPIEVKFFKNGHKPVSKGLSQVVQTCRQMRKYLYGEPEFCKNVFRTFFATQFLANAEKFKANGLLEDDVYEKIESFRYELLNLKYTIGDILPVPEMGHAGLVVFATNNSMELNTVLEDDIAVCQLDFSEKDCLAFVTEENNDYREILVNKKISIDSDTLDYINNPQILIKKLVDDEEVSLEDATESEYNDSQDTVGEEFHCVNQTKIMEINNSNSENPLNNVRALIGKDKFSQEIFWEFGNNKLANRHLLITGTSGYGKSYCIQSLLYELSKSNISSVIIDYTGGFINSKLEQNFIEKMSQKLVQRIVKIRNIPINPFKSFEQDYGDGVLRPEISVDVANRLKSIFSHVYGFGEQQESVIYDAVKNGIDKYGDKMNMILFQEELENINNKYSNSVLSKLKPFLQSVKFDSEDKLDWEEIIYPKEAQCYIFQLSGYDRDIQLVIAEILLWDLWNYSYIFGKKEKPFVVVLDEAQNLSHKKGSPTEKILTEGRKFGWSACFATQSLNVLDDEEVSRLLQSAEKLYFKPIETELLKMSKQLDIKNYNTWFEQLKRLEKSQCIVIGDRYDSNGNLLTNNPIKVTVSALESR